MSEIYDIVIIGAGASGLFLAANLKDKNIAILEKNSCAGKKIIASGGGRCNVTNRYISKSNYIGKPKFIQSILKNLKFKDVLEFFNELKFKEEKKNQFFCSTSSKDILKTLMKRISADFFYNNEVVDIKKEKDIFKILTLKRKFYAKSVVIASGGLSYKSLGATGIGYKIAQDFNLKVTKLSAALVGFSVQKDEFWFKNLSGICFQAEIFIADQTLKGDILFTHKGISGPAILNASLFWNQGHVLINFLPNFDFRNLNGKLKQLSTLLPLPRRFVLEFLKENDLKDKAFDEYSEFEKSKILKLCHYKFAPAGTFGFERAEVTKGGVCTDCLNENLECKSVKELYFIGEVLDVTGMLGGYNLHFAFSCGKVLANYLNGKN